MYFTPTRYVRLEGGEDQGFLASLLIPSIGGVTTGGGGGCGAAGLKRNHSTSTTAGSKPKVVDRNDALADRERSPTSTIAALDKAFSTAYNTAHFDTVSTFYTPNAFLVPQGAHPPAIDGILARDQIEPFFLDVYNAGLKPINLASFQSFPEGDNILHEIGVASPLPDPYWN